MIKIRIGIDVGLRGFITVWRSFDNSFQFFEIPTIGKELDFNKLSKIFEEEIFSQTESHDVFCGLEQNHAIFGASAKSTFNFGKIFGAFKMLLVNFNIPFMEVQPKIWQKEMWKGVNVLKKPSSTGKTSVTDTKKMSLIAAQRLFPKIDLRKNDNCKVAHDGKVDSLLICEYIKRLK